MSINADRDSLTGRERAKSLMQPTKREPRSIRAQLMIVMLGLLIGAFVILQLFFSGFLGRFYRRDKIKTITSIYSELNDLADTSKDFSVDIMKLTAENNIQIVITDADFNAINSTALDSAEMSARLFGYYTGFFREGSEVIRETADYKIQISNDRHMSLQYLEMWGRLSNGDWFLIRTPMQGIDEAVHLASRFFLIIGALVLIASIIIIFLTSEHISKPVLQLTALSKRMANLDFSARYTGPSGNEIGELGEHFNTMSDHLRDAIAELKAANVELRKDNERKTQIDEVRKEFLNNVSHELKTPIGLIQGYAEGLKDNIADDEESREFYCDVIIDEAQKMNTMVRKLLTLNQLEFGQDPIQMERFDLVALIRGVIASMQILIDQHEVRLTFPYDGEVWVWGDEFKIEEVMTNYLSNAINHAEGDKVIEIRLTDRNGLITTSVFNTGKPIPEEDIEHVWEKFYKVDKARTREYGGSGIGLSIVKAIIDGHNQTCGVTNFENGVAFWFTLDGSRPTV